MHPKMLLAMALFGPHRPLPTQLPLHPPLISQSNWDSIAVRGKGVIGLNDGHPGLITSGCANVVTARAHKDIVSSFLLLGFFIFPPRGWWMIRAKEQRGQAMMPSMLKWKKHIPFKHFHRHKKKVVPEFPTPSQVTHCSFMDYGEHLFQMMVHDYAQRGYWAKALEYSLVF